MERYSAPTICRIFDFYIRNKSANNRTLDVLLCDITKEQLSVQLSMTPQQLSMT